MNISVNNDLFGLNRLNCTKDLEDILKKIDTSVICKGYKLKEQLLHSKTTFTDPAGNLRHIMCPLILNHNNDYKHCNNTILTIMRKRLRLQKVILLQREFIFYLVPKYNNFVKITY